MERGSTLSILQRQGDISKTLHRQKKNKGNILNNFIPITLIIIEVDKFLERHKLSKLPQEEIGNLRSTFQMESPLQ